MLWANGNKKPRKLDAESRQEIANNVISKLQQNKDLKVVADNIAGLVAKELKGISDDLELRYAIGVAVSQLKRYIANQVYQRLKGKGE
jgi:transcriptional regulator NrdR family protein